MVKVLSRAPVGGTAGSWRPRRPQIGVPVGLVRVEPPPALALIRAGEGGADRPDLMCVESDRSVECERV